MPADAEKLGKLSEDLRQIGAFLYNALEKLRRGQIVEEFLTAEQCAQMLKALIQPENLKRLNVSGIKIPDFPPSPVTEIGDATSFALFVIPTEVDASTEWRDLPR